MVVKLVVGAQVAMVVLMAMVVISNGGAVEDGIMVEDGGKSNNDTGEGKDNEGRGGKSVDPVVFVEWKEETVELEKIGDC
jgi:hypothetical protein